MDATHSLLDFLKAFESALEQRDVDLQLSRYRQNHYNVIFKTMSPFECQAAEVLTNYALKLTQEQLLQASNYSCVELLDLKTDALQFFNVQRFNYESGRRINNNNYFCVHVNILPFLELFAGIYFMLHHNLT